MLNKESDELNQQSLANPLAYTRWHLKFKRFRFNLYYHSTIPKDTKFDLKQNIDDLGSNIHN